LNLRKLKLKDKEKIVKKNENQERKEQNKLNLEKALL